jgi:outer membrane receptor protein involved in Fe transport
VVPIFKYVSKRYGDALHNEEISGYGTFNMQINYSIKNVDFSLELDNIFNRKYVGRIDTWDDSTGTTTYYAASPFAMIFKTSIKF